MTRLLTFAAALLLLTSPAHACYHFTIWKYPFPQHCGVVQPRGGVAIERRADRKISNSVIAPGARATVTGGAIPDLPIPAVLALPLSREQAATMPDDKQRQMGIDALRPILNDFMNKENRE